MSTLAAIPYGTIIVDNDGETLMSLGVVDQDELVTVQLVPPPEDPREVHIRHIWISLVNNGNRYQVQR